MRHRALLTARRRWIQEEEDFGTIKDLSVSFFFFKGVFVRTCDTCYMALGLFAKKAKPYSRVFTTIFAAIRTVCVVRAYLHSLLSISSFITYLLVISKLSNVPSKHPKHKPGN